MTYWNRQNYNCNREDDHCNNNHYYMCNIF